MFPQRNQNFEAFCNKKIETNRKIGNNVLQTPSSHIFSRKKFFKEKGRKTSRARTLTKNQFLGNALGLDSHQKSYNCKFCTTFCKSFVV